MIVSVGSTSSLSMLLSAHRVDFPSLRHNDMRDITTNLLTEVCHNVAVEPDLQTLTGKQFQHRTANTEDGARLDVNVQGFWGDKHQGAFFDIRSSSLTHQATATPPWNQCTVDMKERRGAAMKGQSAK